MSKNETSKAIVARIAELGSAIDWQKCIDAALAQVGFDELPEDRNLLRYFVADALRVELEKEFGAEAAHPVVGAILSDLGSAPRERKSTLERAKRVRRLSQKLTLPNSADGKQRPAVVECLGFDKETIALIRAQVPMVKWRTHRAATSLMNTTRETSEARQIFLIDARQGMDHDTLKTLLGSLRIGQTIVWLDDPTGVGLKTNQKHLICDAGYGLDDIAALLRIAFFNKTC